MKSWQLWLSVIKELGSALFGVRHGGPWLATPGVRGMSWGRHSSVRAPCDGAKEGESRESPQSSPLPTPPSTGLHHSQGQSSAAGPDVRKTQADDHGARSTHKEAARPHHPELAGGREKENPEEKGP